MRSCIEYEQLVDRVIAEGVADVLPCSEKELTEDTPLVTGDGVVTPNDLPEIIHSVTTALEFALPDEFHPEILDDEELPQQLAAECLSLQDQPPTIFATFGRLKAVIKQRLLPIFTEKKRETKVSR
jgi:hypothetical protein